MIGCPICHGETHPQILHGINLDVCPKHGVWMDTGELLLVSEAERHKHGRFVLADLLRQEQQPPVDAGRALACPCCDAPMVLELYAGVHLDWCPNHGVWLDTGELSAVFSNLRRDHRYRRGMTLRLWAARY